MADLNFWSVFDHWEILLAGAKVTLWLSLVTAVLGLILGTVLAVAKKYGPRPVRWAATAYIELWRNSPLLVQLFFFYFGLTSLGINLSPLAAATWVFTLNVAAYIAEIIRGGFAAVASAHIQAARALALTPWQIFRYVIMPPTMAASALALENELILLALATSQASLISAPELTFQASVLNAEIFRTFEIYIVLMGIYMLISRGLMLVVGAVNRRLFRVKSANLIPAM